jgi:hypothetical protein
MPFPLNIVKKFSPVFQFHENERFFPCSVDYLLQDSVLLYRNFTFGRPIVGQTSSSTPTIATFNGWLYMAYQETRGYQIYISRSRNGMDWEDTQKVNGVQGGAPTLVVFQGKLWMVYHGVFSAQLWIACSRNGLNWERMQKIVGQKAWRTTITVYRHKLFMVYPDPGGSQLWMSESPDGTDWFNTSPIEGQLSTNVDIAFFNGNIVMVYIAPQVNLFRIFLSHFHQNTWSEPILVDGMLASSLSLAVVGNSLFMVYGGPTDSPKLFAARSLDLHGRIWQDFQELKSQQGENPSIAVMNGNVHVVYRNSTQLMATFCERGDLSQHTPISNPTQVTLQSHPSESYYVSINPVQYDGQSIGSAPLYYAIQERGNDILINYLILYANQGGQTVRALRAASEFDCIINTIGHHQGDLERFAILLGQDADGYSVLEVGFEAHGHLETYHPSQVRWEENTHAVVHVALNGHACRNHDPEEGPVMEFSVPGFVAIGGWLGLGPWWRPHSYGSEFKQLGLDNVGAPVSDQVWSVFRGRLGDVKINSLQDAMYFDGTNLSAEDWAFVQFVFGFATVLALIPRQLLIGDGPVGPGVREWVSN